MDNIIDYDNAQKDKRNKKKHKWEEHKEKVNISENESEKLESGCESDENSGTTEKKYLIFKLQKHMVNYKLELGTYFSTRYDFKAAITTYVFKSGRNLKFTKNDKKIRLRLDVKRV